MNAKFPLWRLTASVFVFVAVACAQSQSKAIAVVNGESITEDEVQKAAAPELEKLDQKQKQFMATLERDKKSAVEDALEDIVNRKLLEEIQLRIRRIDYR